MWIAGVHLPEGLLSALNDGRLVIFAGAGVSAGPPSDIPSFPELTETVQTETGDLLEWNSENESPDRFLGRLEERGSNIHRIVRRIVGTTSSRPAEVHNALVALFRSVEHLRIVTTNYDTHFESVARAAFGSRVPVYRAPALPLGHKFSGIVYVKLRTPCM